MHGNSAYQLSDEHTPIQGSGTYPLYKAMALEQIEKLKQYSVPKSVEMAKKFKEYAEIFDSWCPANRPSEENRAQVIQDFIELARDSFEFCCSENSKKYSSRPPIPHESGTFLKG